MNSMLRKFPPQYTLGVSIGASLTLKAYLRANPAQDLDENLAAESRSWVRTVMTRLVLPVVARTPRRQRRRRSNWAKTRQYELFVLVRIDSSIRSQYKQILIQYKKSVFNTFTLYWFVLVCIVTY